MSIHDLASRLRSETITDNPAEQQHAFGDLDTMEQGDWEVLARLALAIAAGDRPGAIQFAAERFRQIDVEGYTPEDDARHGDGQLAQAAACYALPEHDRENSRIVPGNPAHWPWGLSWWKPRPQDRRAEIVKAGGLLAAEIDRLRAEVPR